MDLDGSQHVPDPGLTPFLLDSDAVEVEIGHDMFHCEGQQTVAWELVCS